MNRIMARLIVWYETEKRSKTPDILYCIIQYKMKNHLLHNILGRNFGGFLGTKKKKPIYVNFIKKLSHYISKSDFQEYVCSHLPWIITYSFPVINTTSA